MNRRSRLLLAVALAVVGLLAVLVIVDRAAVAYADGQVAGRLQSQGFGSRPSVRIKGFPFLTQALGGSYPQVEVSGTDIQDQSLTITSLDVTATDVRTTGSKGTIGAVDGTATITFADLAKAAGQSVALSAAGPDQVQASVDLGLTTAIVTASVTKDGDQIKVQAVSVQGLPLSDLGQNLDFSVPVPQLPLGLAFQSVSVTTQGVLLHVTGTNVAFG